MENAKGINVLKRPEVLKMLDDINSVDEIPAYLEKVKNSKRDSQSKLQPKISPLKLMGFGHRIYKNSDPRSILCKKLVFELFELMGKNKRGHIALELEKQVLGDEYFVSRKLFPNIDFWLALAFDTLGFPSDMFAIWMFIPRVSGFLAHWVETLDDPEYKIFRPRQIYVGQDLRLYVDITSNMNEPKLRSQAPVIHRPQSMYTRTDGFGSAGVLEELGDIDFDIGAKQTSQSKLSSWWQKQFKAEKPVKPEPSNQVDLLKQQIKLLTARVTELEDHGSVGDGPRSKQSSQLASKHARVIDPKGSK